MRLKTIVGFPDTATLQTIDEAYNADKEKFARNYNATDATYRQMCQWLFDDVQDKNASLSTEKLRVQQVKDHSASLEEGQGEADPASGSSSQQSGQREDRCPGQVS